MKIAILGTGLMGSGFAEGLMNAGHEVIVYNRTASRTKSLVALGAKAVNTPIEAFETADASILVLIDSKAVRDTLFNDATKASLKGKKILNASTTSIEEITEIIDEAAKNGCDIAEASILTGPDDLRTKQSSFFLGCSQSDKSFWEKLLGSVGSNVFHVGATGSATRAESPYVFNSVFGLMMTSYTACVIRKLNLPAELIDMYTPVLGAMGEYMLPGMIAGDYDEITATVNNNLTVSQTAVSNAKAFGFPNEVFIAISKLFEETVERGYGEKNGSAVCETILASEI